MPNKHTRKVAARRVYQGNGTRYYGRSSQSKRGAQSKTSEVPAVHAFTGAPEIKAATHGTETQFVESAVTSQAGTGAAVATMPGSAGGMSGAVGRRGKSWTAGRVLKWALGLVGVAALAAGGYGVF
jgi:hypothetical protein